MEYCHTPPINPEAKRLHDQGRAAGERAEYDAALSLLTEAANLDPAWPYPIYDRAFTHLLKGEIDEALRDYERTLELSPRGFYIAAQAVDMLRREATGELPEGLFVALVRLEHATAEEQRSTLERMVEASPSCAQAWDRYANFINDPAARLLAIERGLATPCDSDTRGSLLVRKALTLWEDGQTSRALDILQPLTATVGESLSTHATAYIALTAIRGATGDGTSISERK
jgi:tetratricopeptide (TPR) repeat protein